MKRAVLCVSAGTEPPNRDRTAGSAEVTRRAHRRAPEAGATARQMAHDERLLSRCPRSEQYSAGPSHPARAARPAVWSGDPAPSCAAMPRHPERKSVPWLVQPVIVEACGSSNTRTSTYCDAAGHNRLDCSLWLGAASKIAGSESERLVRIRSPETSIHRSSRRRRRPNCRGTQENKNSPHSSLPPCTGIAHA